MIRAHRDTQADHRAALAADHARDLAAARRRLDAIDTRLRTLGHPQLADQLLAETRSGTALIVALTCPDQPGGELAAALTAFAHNRHGVDASRVHAASSSTVPSAAFGHWALNAQPGDSSPQPTLGGCRCATWVVSAALARHIGDEAPGTAGAVRTVEDGAHIELVESGLFLSDPDSTRVAVTAFARLPRSALPDLAWPSCRALTCPGCATYSPRRSSRFRDGPDVRAALFVLRSLCPARIGGRVAPWQPV